FFQAEDGIRDGHVTGVQTCALPIFLEYSPLLSDHDLLEIIASARAQSALAAVARRRGVSERVSEVIVASLDVEAVAALLANPNEIGRASCRERVQHPGVAACVWRKE